jgi:hypothetical protein
MGGHRRRGSTSAAMALTVAVAVAVAALGATAGCGGALVPGDSADHPVFEVHGSLLAPSPDMRVGVVWVDPLGLLDDRPSPPSLSAATIEPDGRFDVRFFGPPPADVIRRIPSPDDPTRVAFAFAFAEIVAFEDRDGDGTFGVASLAAGAGILAPDVYRGIGATHAILFVEQRRQDDGIVIAELDTVLAGQPGYHLTVFMCSGGTAVGFPVDPRDYAVDVAIVPPQAALPEPETRCFRAHP